MGIYTHAVRYKKCSIADSWRYAYLQFFAAENLPTSDYLNPQNSTTALRKRIFGFGAFLPITLYMLYSLLDQVSQVALGMQGSGTLAPNDSLKIFLRFIILTPFKLAYEISLAIFSPINHIWRPFSNLVSGLWQQSFTGKYFALMAVMMVIAVTAAVALSIFTGGAAIPGILIAVQFIGPLIHSFLAAQILLTLAAFAGTMLIITNVASIIKSFFQSPGYDEKEAAIQRECAEANGQIDYVNANSRYNRSNALSYQLFNTPLFVPPLLGGGVIAQLPQGGVIAQLPPAPAPAIASPNQILQQVTAAKGNQTCSINEEGENGLLTDKEIKNLKLCIKRGLADYPERNPDPEKAKMYLKMIRELNHYVGTVGKTLNSGYGREYCNTPQEPLRIHFADGYIATCEYSDIANWLGFRIGHPQNDAGRQNPADANRMPGIERSLEGATYHYGLPQVDIDFITQTRSYLARPKVQAYIAQQAAAALKAPVAAERVDAAVGDIKDVKEDNPLAYKPLVDESRNGNAAAAAATAVPARLSFLGSINRGEGDSSLSPALAVNSDSIELTTLLNNVPKTGYSSFS